ncbi:bifunctional aminoimidazole ribotide synthase/glycinamide ribotide synthase [Ascoidea rubescens DSM 1968]|uniref:Purine biosynthetic pathway protein ADE5,7 n=1 Tax=Ascoidea rubescens DSM 1968 TaxID=1344418 RepID=A0A1D2VA23_9ASCO|nr:purine biosynthetic pathway protein ADE5,7 [Ascoidea rubescens DSM 1968]ODV58494.1 purine biosynthetic pathway protein ADE5,7 [Ascoidea rubescens DSM 1968]
MSLNILLLGNGGRESALSYFLNKSDSVSKIYIAPGNANQIKNSKIENVPINTNKSDFPKLLDFSLKKDINLVIPGPEQPLVDGISKVFQNHGIPVFGPSELAARMEGSKTFSKDFMKKHSIPTAKYQNFSDYESAKNYIDSIDYDIVIKASGIAGGKGVLIPQSKQEALDGLHQVMVQKNFGDAGDEVVIEEFLQGDELSILAFSDGYTIIDLPPAQDHKRIGNNDTGLNTGGMGTYAPAPVGTPKLLKKIRETILKPTIDGMRKDGFPFVGMLFTGIMLTKSGPKVLEYNVRFGDPETQSVLPLLSDDSDLAQICLACAEHRLDSVKVDVKEDCFATTVVMAAQGYPESYKTGDEIVVDYNNLPQNSYIFHAGTKYNSEGKIVTSGGRVIAATAFGKTLEKAVASAYKGVDCVHFNGKYFRTDIAYRAFKDQKNVVANSTITYEDAGVSVDNGNLLVDQIKQKVKSTQRPGADSDIGGFGGLFDLKASGYSASEALLVAATDGVGTKLIIAQEMNIHNTVGIDLVAMNVNDLVVQGAEPLLFLDYFATGSLDIKVATDFVSGVADGCIQAGCALIGGETSEMPGMYGPGHYDTNGTSVGAVLKSNILPKTNIMSKGNVILGLASNGLHSNGYSLVRKIIKVKELSWFDKAPWDSNTSVGKSCLTPTKIYVKQLLPLISKGLVLGLANITGGGLVENIPRALPKHLSAKIDMKSWNVPEIFKWFGKVGNIPTDDIFKTFNMGIGMALICEKASVNQVTKLLEESGETVYQIGELIDRNDSTPGCFIENTNSLY